MTLYILNYNNYYDRIVKREESLNDYLAHEVFMQEGCNFHTADGVNTTHIIGGPIMYDGTGNYVLAVDNGEIQSRWFIIENNKTRGGQFEITLHRDLVVDYYTTIVSSPCFIEKATLDKDNPLIFNAEDMEFNQIKTAETKLCDSTSVPWIIGYFNKEHFNTDTTFTIPLETVQSYIAYPTMDDIPYIQQIRSGKYVGALTSVAFQTRSSYGGSLYYDRVQHYQDKTWTRDVFNIDDQDDYGLHQVPSEAQGELSKENMYSPEIFFTAVTNKIFDYYNSSDTLQTQLRNTVGAHTQSEVNSFLSTISTSGITVRTGSASSDYKYYKIKRTGSYSTTTTESVEPGTILYSELLNAVDPYMWAIRDIRRNFTYRVSYTTYTLSIEELPGPRSFKVTISANDKRTHLQDSPYDMFAIPYGGVTLERYISGGVSEASNVVLDKDVCMQAANAIAEELGGIGNNLLFDLQLLPYCPINSCRTTYGQIDLTDLRVAKDFTWFDEGLAVGGVNGIIMFPDKSDFSFIISKTLDRDDPASILPKSVAVNITEPKIQSQCDTYRLVSPNYNGQFEFNAAKNGGVQYYEVDCTYKPFSPYIHVCPNFGKLYGKDFNDARGLVCGGDFSLPTITDQWISYEINNKNYLNTFNRQIENMEINNKYQKRKEEISVAIGALTAGVTTGMVSGVSTGGAIGGKYGALAGGLVGVATGVIAGGASKFAGEQDIMMNDKLRNEALDYKLDLFGYELGNIRALPYSLNRVSAFNINNKVFPIVEYYTCTDAEKQALRDKVKYNGMSVGTIGSIAAYIQPEKSYIKGKIIRFDSKLVDDFHIAKAISEEIYKGVFI